MSKKHNIFVIWGWFPPFIGGGSARGYRLFNALSERGHSVTVFTTMHPGSKTHNRISSTFNIISIPPSLIYPSKTGRYSRVMDSATSTIRYINLYILLTYFCLRQKPDTIIKEATTWVYSLPSLYKYIKFDGFHTASSIAPWVLIKTISHVPLFVYFTGLWKRPQRHYLDYAYSADKIIVVDKWMINALKDKGVENEFLFLPVCVDTNVFQPSHDPPNDTVLFVGRLEQGKGCDVLIKAAPAIIRKVPGCRIKIVGTGNEAQALQMLAGKLNIMANTIFTGEINPHRVEEMYKGAKVMVNPLRLPGISNVTIEAMACGVPVVKSIIDGYDCYPIQDGHNGYLFKVDDYSDLADKVVKTLQNPHWSLLSQAARETSMQFDIKASVDKLEQIINIF